MQQQLFNNSLKIAAGRLAPSGTFATMPVLNKYINGGINPVPGHSGPTTHVYLLSTGVEWGVQAIYNLIPRAFQFAAGVFNTNQSSAAGR